MTDLRQQRIRSAGDVPCDALRACLNESFADYLINFPNIAATEWDTFLRRQGCDLRSSLIYEENDLVVAFALVTPRASHRWRIAVMGARPHVRGTGVAARLLDTVISTARSNRLNSLELEVFAQNASAVGLYRSRGFSPVTSLFGFEAMIGSHGELHRVQVVDVDEAEKWIHKFELGSELDLPWQVCADAVRGLPGCPVSWRIDDAQLVFSERPGLISVVSLLDRDLNYRGATRLLGCLRAAFPDAILRAPQLQAEHGPALAFKAAGWQPQNLYQSLMKRSLDA